MRRHVLSRLSLEWKLPIAICLLLALITITLSWIAYAEVERSARKSAAERLANLSDELVSQLAREMGEFSQQARTLSRASRAALVQAVERDTIIVAVDRQAGDSSLEFAHGALASAVATLPHPPLNGAESTAVGPLQKAGEALVYAASARGPDGAVTTLWRELRRDTTPRDQIAAVLGPGSTLFIGSMGGIWTDQHAIVPPPPLDVTLARGVMHYRRPSLGERIAYARAAEGNRWVALLEFPESLVLAPAHNFLRRIILVSTVLLALGFLATWLASRRITRPLRELTAVAGAISEGRYADRVVHDGSDELARLAVAFNVMSDRVEDEIHARRQSELQWRTLFESNPQPMWVNDLETFRFLAVNDAAIQQYGYSRDEFLALSVLDIRPPEDVPRFLESIADSRGDQAPPVQLRHRRKNGTTFDAEISSHTIDFAGRRAWLVLAQDISVRTALETQLRQSQKMEAVGRLAGGVAHDFNNLLTVMMTYADLVRADLPDGDPRAEDLDVIIRATTQAQGLTRQLLAFSRQQVLQPVVVDPNAAITELGRMLHRLIGEDVEFVTELDPAIGRVKVDRGQFDQVLLNLAVNARDAMPRGGRLIIRTANTTVGEETAKAHGLTAGMRCVSIYVIDNGAGMTDETRARIFEPFFTTKEVGKGTGLGLATVYGIVEQSGGYMEVQSALGHGATFEVCLPRLAGDAGQAEGAAADSPSRGGSETILLVEDDAAVRGVTQAVLTRHGYAVIVASQGEEALEAAGRPSQRIDLVITDVVMPGIDGPQLVIRLRELRPHIKALFISGYAGDDIVRRGVLDSGVPFLEKPFTVKALTRRVRDLLDAG